jgi:hypothetical protein
MKTHLPCILAFALFLPFISCNRVKEGTKEVINKTGETVGRASGKFLEGVSEGVDRSFDCEIILSENLKNKGITTGKFTISDSSGRKNQLSLYLIFNKDFNSRITARVSDKKGLENGRSSVDVMAKANDARFVNFVFQPETDIEVKSKIYIE